MEDKLICCVQGNPEPVVFRLCCQGVQVELGVSPKELSFNTLLLPRSVTPQPLAGDESCQPGLLQVPFNCKTNMPIKQLVLSVSFCLQEGQ